MGLELAKIDLSMQTGTHRIVSSCIVSVIFHHLVLIFLLFRLLGPAHRTISDGAIASQIFRQAKS